jgi:hypothetical protein
MVRVLASKFPSPNLLSYPIFFKLGNVPKKRKRKKLTAATLVKSAARAVLGTPPPVKRRENKKLRKEKHKATLGKLLAD